MKKIFILDSSIDYHNYIKALSHFDTKIIHSKDINFSDDCDMLLLPGGGDPHPSLYGETNTHCNNIDTERDKKELLLINKFSDRKIFGICRGLQILNVAFGGSLNQDLENLEMHSRCLIDKDKTHVVHIKNTSCLQLLYQNKIQTNSAHHQSVKKIAKDLDPIAFAEDNTIEALVHKVKPILAVQWHPERIFEDNSGKILFEYVLNF